MMPWQKAIEPSDLLKPGINIKRWVLLGIVGVFSLVLGIIMFFNNSYSWPVNVAFPIFIILLGTLILYIVSMQVIKFFIVLVNIGNEDVAVDSKNIGDLIYEKRALVKGPKIVVIGG